MYIHFSAPPARVRGILRTISLLLYVHQRKTFNSRELLVVNAFHSFHGARANIVCPLSRERERGDYSRTFGVNAGEWE